MKQRYRFPFAHHIGDRHSDRERAEDALRHDKGGLSHPVIKSDEAKQKTSQQTVNTVSFQIVRGSRDNRRVIREDAGEKISVEERQIKHQSAEGK